ncbi:hypothetical protein [Neobacillus bataviensis]|uniref:hypothetical protein n=1 Tax=Neobacillus bataviensis TaxID=220685 RepID=UPI001CBDABCF|nr:hypothetical protein [Neobacillus bataviensis]
MPNEPHEEPQEQPQVDIQALKDEIKSELKEEFSHLRHKRKHRVIYSICVFAVGLVIGFGGGAVSHSDHHHSHGPGHEQFQKWHHMHK